MKKFQLVLLGLIIISNINAQECIKTFESNYLRVSICNNLDWKIEHSLPYIKIKTSMVETFVTFYSEQYKGKETNNQIVQRYFNLDKETYPTIEKTKEEELTIDGIKGILYIAKVPNKNIQLTTFITTQNGRILAINNNCYSECNNAEIAVKSVIKNTKFQTLENPKLTEQEILNLEKFREKFECTLKKGSQKKFEKLLITQPLMLELIQTKMKDETMKNRFTNIINNKWTEFSKEFIDESKKSFSELIENGERLGIKWKKIKTIEFDYKLNSSLPGISSAEFIYKFSFKDKKYEISINSLESLEKGFYISKMNSSYISEI